MNREDMLRLATLGENPWIELKENLADPHKIGETISAVANAALLADESHGYIVWGFSGMPAAEVGTAFSPSMKIGNEPLELHLANMLRPRVQLDWWEVTGPAGRLVALRVSTPRVEPLAYKGHRKCRVGSHNQALNEYPHLERELWAKLAKDHPEAKAVFENVHTQELEKLLDLDSAARLMVVDPAAVVSALCDVGALTPLIPGRFDVPFFTVLALARSFDGIPHVARHTPRLVLYGGRDKRTGLKEIHATRGIALGFPKLLQTVTKDLPTREAYVGGRRVVRAIPELVVRELLLNALVHQDLAATGAGPLIEVFSDRLEVSNPGRPLESDVRRLLDLPPKSRNEGLATLMHRFNYVEERGSGIDKVILELEDAHLAAPAFEANEHSLSVTVYGPQEFAEISRRERLSTIYYHSVVRYLTAQRSSISNRTVRERFGLHSGETPTVSRLLKGAVTAGWIREDEDAGAGRSQSYLPFWVGS